jgi:hypothetical protein
LAVQALPSLHSPVTGLHAVVDAEGTQAPHVLPGMNAPLAWQTPAMRQKPAMRVLLQVPSALHESVVHVRPSEHALGTL